MAMATTTRDKSNDVENSWNELYTAINSAARMMGKFGWSDEVSAEYIKHLGKLHCDPARALEAFNDLLESTGEMPGFREVAERSLQFDMETRFMFGPNGEHIDRLPAKILLERKKPTDPPRYAMAFCGCADCRPSRPPTLGSKPAVKEPGHWQKRAAELAPQGKKGFRQLLKELQAGGNPMGAIKVRS